MENKRVTMKDIAVRVGCHQTTVSLALKNDPRISSKTKKLIEATAKKMGYVPDPALTSLVSYRQINRVKRQTEVLALIFDVKDEVLFHESDYFISTRDVVIARAAELGYKVEVFTQGVDFCNTAMLDRVLLTRNIHAVLFGAIICDNFDYQLSWDQYSIVKISQSPIQLEVDSVMGNHFFSTRKVMRKLKEAGFKRPAMAGAIESEYNTRNLFKAGFMFGQSKHFAPENHIPYYEFDRKPNAKLNEEIYEWLKQVKPDVLISYWNNLIEPAYRITVEDGHYCRFVCTEADRYTIQCGGIVNNYRKMAQTAVELLISKMRMNERGLPESPTLILVDEKWHDLGPWPPEKPLYGGTH